MVALSAGNATADMDRMRAAFAKAYLTNPTLEAQRAQVRAVDENVNQAVSLSRPSVTLRASAGAGMFSNDTGIRQTDGSSTPISSELEVAQPLYRGGTNSASVKRAENQVLAARAALVGTEQQIFLDAGRAYMDVVRDQAIVDLRRNNVVVLRRQLQATRDRFEVGEVTRTDVSQAEARLASAEGDFVQAEGDLASSRATFTQIVGEPPGFLEFPRSYDKLPNSREEAIQFGAVNNPLVIEATFNHLAAARDVRAIYGELLPSADLVGRARYDSEVYDARTEGASAEALLQLTVPLYQGGSVRSRVRQAKQIASQRLVEIEQARRNAIEEAVIGWEQLVAAVAREKSLRSEVRAQEIALEGVKQEALVGTRTVLDELNAEQELLNARVSLVDARRNQVVAALVLAVSTGLLTVEALELEVPHYDVRTHYESVRSTWTGTGVDANWQPASGK